MVTGRAWPSAARWWWAELGMEWRLPPWAASEIGRISGMLSGVETLTTPLVRQMDRFARWLTILILLIAAVLLTFGYFVEHHEFSELFMAVVGLSVAAIPEGLPAVADHHTRNRCTGHGKAKRHCPPLAGDRDAGIRLSDLHRQDRHADA